MIRATFGERAAWYEARLPQIADPLVVFELHAIERALPAMIATRMRAGRLTIAPLIDAPRVALVERLAAAIFAQHRETESRAAALLAYAQGSLLVSGRQVSEIGPYDPRDLAQLREALLLADCVIAPSRTAAGTIEGLANVRAAETVLLTPPSRPTVSQSLGDAIVIWDRTGIAALRAWFTFALRAFARRVIVAGPGEEARLVDARVVVLTESLTPLEAWRIASCGAPLVVDRASGAHEWLAGALTFDRTDTRTLARAVRTSLGTRAPHQRSPAVQAQVTIAMRPAGAEAAEAALIVRTRDRPELLARALASVEAQTHAGTRAIVINDGGASVASLVACFPRATLIERPLSAYRTAANEALASTTAVFVGVLDDDDALAPRHIESLVDALVRSGCDLAVCGTAMTYVESPKELRVTGYTIVDAPALERSALLIGNTVPGATRVLVRADVLRRLAGFNTDLFVAADYELWLRLTAASDAVRVRGIEVAYTVFNDRANRSLAPGVRQHEALRTIYALHPTGNRPGLEAARRALLGAVERHGGYPVLPATRSTVAPVWLLDDAND